MGIEIQFLEMPRSGFIRNQSRVLLVNYGFDILKTLDISHFQFFTNQNIPLSSKPSNRKQPLS
jgi:hypothetical protein